MSVAIAKQLIHKVAEDAAFRQKLESTPLTEKRALLTSYGFDTVSAEDLEIAGRSLSRTELSDAELEAVAGGSICGWIECVGTLVGAIAIAVFAP